MIDKLYLDCILSCDHEKQGCCAVIWPDLQSFKEDRFLNGFIIAIHLLRQLNTEKNIQKITRFLRFSAIV